VAGLQPLLDLGQYGLAQLPAGVTDDGNARLADALAVRQVLGHAPRTLDHPAGGLARADRAEQAAYFGVVVHERRHGAWGVVIHDGGHSVSVGMALPSITTDLLLPRLMFRMKPPPPPPLSDAFVPRPANSFSSLPASMRACAGISWLWIIRSYTGSASSSTRSAFSWMREPAPMSPPTFWMASASILRKSGVEARVRHWVSVMPYRSRMASALESPAASSTTIWALKALRSTLASVLGKVTEVFRVAGALMAVLLEFDKQVR